MQKQHAKICSKPPLVRHLFIAAQPLYNFSQPLLLSEPSQGSLMDIILGLVPQDGQKVCNSPPAIPCAVSPAAMSREWSNLHRSQTDKDKPYHSSLGTNSFFLCQHVDGNEPPKHQSLSKRYLPPSSSPQSNSLSQLPWKPRQKLSKSALTPGQQQCHPRTFLLTL